MSSGEGGGGGGGVQRETDIYIYRERERGEREREERERELSVFQGVPFVTWTALLRVLSANLNTRETQGSVHGI